MRAVDAASIVGRLLFGGFWIYSGFNHFLAGEELSGFAASRGVPFPELAVFFTGLLLLGGGLSIVLGAWPRVGLLLLVVFLVGVTPMMHAFWTFDDPQARFQQTMSFLRNVAYLGAVLALLAIPVPWVWSLGEGWRLARGAEARRPT